MPNGTQALESGSTAGVEGLHGSARPRWPSARARRAPCLFVASWVGSLSAGACFAQTNVPSPGQLAPKSFSPEESTPAPPLTYPERTRPTDVVHLKVTVGRFTVESADPELARLAHRILSRLQGHPVQINAIYAAVAEVEQAYVERGHFLTRLVIPPQHVPVGGELRLRVIRGFIQWVDVEGVPQGFRARAEASLAPLVGRTSLTRAQLERALLILGEVPGLSIRAMLRPGPAEGAAILVLSGDYRGHTSQLSVDNSMPQALGRTSATLSTAYTSDSGAGEQEYLTFSAPVDFDPISAHDPRRLLAGGLRGPIGLSGDLIDIQLTWATTAPTPTPDVLTTQSTFERFSLRDTYPIIKSRTTVLVAEASAEATSEVENAPQFGTRLYDDELRVLRLGLSGDHVFTLDTRGSFGVELSKGFHGLGSRGPMEATEGPPLSQLGASDEFWKLEWHAVFQQQLPANTAVDLQVQGQTANSPVLASEKFTMGGPTDLSAYDLASFSGDRGWSARADLQRALKWPQLAMTSIAQYYVFAAHGEVVTLMPTFGEQHTSIGSSAGVGFRASLARPSGSLGPIDLSGEFARQLNPAPGRLPDRWRVNFLASIDF